MALKYFEHTLPRNAANHVPLSPLSFIRRARNVFPEHPAVIYGEREYSWRELYERAVRLASALRARGIGMGDTVSIMAANTPELLEAHFGVPMAGAVLNTVNTRLDADTVAYILEHGDSQLLISDTQFSPVVSAALSIRGNDAPPVIDLVDEQAELGPGEGGRVGELTYEELLESGDPDFEWRLPDDEWQAIALNYTSGTSGRPKGVVYHHRGAYLMSLGTIAAWSLPANPRYLYTVPMFHCNGWGHGWTMAAVAGTAVCCRKISAKTIFNLIAEHRVTHFGGAPVVLGLLVNAPEEERRAIEWPVKAMTAGAPPPSAVIEKMRALGFEVMQVYGLTETFGHVVQCAWHEEWDALPFDRQAEIKARQGVAFPMTEEVRVVHTDTGERVVADGTQLGEILIRGNTVMKGYYKDSAATANAFKDGYFHSEDLAVVHPDGYVEVRDRLKDVIISGGENISSVEVESVLYKHPAVALAAVVARPDEKWGEVPVAFVELKNGQQVDEAELIAFSRQHLAGFKSPKAITFGELPKTATGKIQKFVLRQNVRAG